MYTQVKIYAAVILEILTLAKKLHEKMWTSNAKFYKIGFLTTRANEELKCEI